MTLQCPAAYVSKLQAECLVRGCDQPHFIFNLTRSQVTCLIMPLECIIETAVIQPCAQRPAA
jgi:hypothetical protein